MSKKPESLLSKRIASFLRTNYPDVIYKFDLASDQHLSIGQAKRNSELHGKWSKGHPDLVIYRCKLNKKGKIKRAGLFIELKAGVKVPNTAHTRTQAAFHQLLRAEGYEVHFGCGYEQTVAIIRDYLGEP